ncbi:MAG: ABC transporter substrate-binding protein [Candidatus Omnitrophica bacterium]|nr:ABC transporter substrate-binding protein [Candidatus Omnitrophota bacterium]
MKKIILLLSFVIAGSILLGTAGPAFSQKDYQRVISLAPSITEVLYALGQEDKIIGVTRYCKYPPEAQQKQKVGGVLDTGFEMIYRLNPDLVILTSTETDQTEKLKQMGIEFLAIDAKSVSGILDAIEAIGETLDCKEAALSLRGSIEQHIKDIQFKTKDSPKLRVLITYLRPVGESMIRDVYIAGNDTYYNDLIKLVGGINAYQGGGLITSPIVSTEGILRMNPDVIIEINNMVADFGIPVEEILKDWEMLPELDAYKNRRIHIFDQPYVGIPGPRLAEALEDLARVIHPELIWEER